MCIGQLGENYNASISLLSPKTQIAFIAKTEKKKPKPIISMLIILAMYGLASWLK